METLEGIGSIRASSIKKFTDFDLAENEIHFIEKYKITPLFITDKNYPRRLLNCYDSPAMLYYRGNADLNSSKIIAIVGTRNNNEYGKIICEKLIEELAGEGFLMEMRNSTNPESTYESLMGSPIPNGATRYWRAAMLTARLPSSPWPTRRARSSPIRWRCGVRH